MAGASRNPQRELACFRLGKARLQDLLALVPQMRAQDVGQPGTVAALERVQDRFVLLHGQCPTLWIHRRDVARAPDARRHGRVEPGQRGIAGLSLEGSYRPS